MRNSPDFPARRKAARGWHPGMKMMLFLGVIAVLAGTVGVTPWAVHMGGKFTPLGRWDGYGPVRASNGGRYELFVHLQGGKGVRQCGVQGCDDLRGSAKLCARSGQIDSFKLRGTVDGWWSTEGAKATLLLSGGSPVPLQEGWLVVFTGAWRGPVLRLASTDNSFTGEFAPDGTIRRVTSSADSGSARTELAYGTMSQFSRACRDLEAHRQ